MKLDKTQIKALTSQLLKEINTKISDEYYAKFEERRKELQNKFDADTQYVEACLSKCPFKVNFAVPILTDAVFYGKGWEITDYQVKAIYPCNLITYDTLKNEIIIASIEATNLDSLINTIKNKYAN